MKTNYIVNYGVTSRHLFESKGFELLRDAKNFIEKIPTAFNAYNIVRVSGGKDFNPATIEKIIEKIY